MSGPGVAGKLIGAGFALAAGAAAWAYPVSPWLLLPALLAYAAVLAWRPHWWLLLVPALLPAIDLAPWTGWFYLEEVDILLMVTAAVGYWRLGPVAPQARLPRLSVAALLLLTLAYAIGTVRGLGTPPALDPNAFASYLSHYNSLRVAKGFFWALALLPLVLRSIGPGLANLRALVVPGMLLGLAAVCAAAIRERMLFPGLLNFSADYRITAPFSAMHTGGAALDGYLALAMPFLAAWIVGERGRLRMAFAMLLLVLGAYVGLATFSRGVYLAYACSVLLFAAFALQRGRRAGRLGTGRLLALLGMLGLAAASLHAVFGSSGYRGLAAGIAVLAAVFLLGGLALRTRRSRPAQGDATALLPQAGRRRASSPGAHLLAFGAAALLTGLSILLSLDAVAATPLAALKGVYGCFAASAALFAAGIGLVFFGAPGRAATGRLLARTALWWMMANAVLVARHWGGNAAVPAMLLLLAFGAALLVLNRMPATRLWQTDRHSLRFAFCCSVVLALAIPFSASDYMSGRFSTVHGDLDGRIDHWTEALAMMTPDPATGVFGMGLGRYPDTYFWKNQAHEVPSTVEYVRQAQNSFLRLGGPTYPRGYGEVIRLLQRLDVRPGTAYLFSVDVRHRAKQPALDVALCERQLLYPQNCLGLPVRLAGTDDGQWHRYEARVNSGALGAGIWPLRAPVQLQMSTYGERTIVDVDNLSLVDLQSGAELIRNGGFHDGHDHWFFSSDRHHLPFHVKNFFLNMYFELGWLGIASLCLFLGHALVRLLAGSLADEPMAQIGLAALVGFLLVGLFDSLLDVPRLSLLFYLLPMLLLLQPVGATGHSAPLRKRRRRSHRGHAVMANNADTANQANDAVAGQAAAPAYSRQAEKSANAP